MKYITNFGEIAEKLPPLMLGCNVFGWSVKLDDSEKLLDEAYARGINFLDTADCYPPIGEQYHGLSESIIGKWLKHKNRSNIVIATKIGMSKKREGLYRKNLIKGLDESLGRLNTDYIDIYYAHCDDPSIPVHEFMDTFSDMVQSGKVRMIGLSNFSNERLALATEVDRHIPARVTQLHFSLLHREKMNEILNTVVSNDLHVFPYYVLEQGYLTGKYLKRDAQTDTIRGARLKNKGILDDPENREIITKLAKISKEYNVPMAALAIEWIKHQPRVTLPIVSVSQASQFDDILTNIDRNNTELLNKLDNI
jgi:aryl-alcohol dehydrogenase-like predicted oxidoreductase